MSIKLEDLDKEELLKLWSYMHADPYSAGLLRETIRHTFPAEYVQKSIDELCETGEIAEPPARAVGHFGLGPVT